MTTDQQTTQQTEYVPNPLDIARGALSDYASGLPMLTDEDTFREHISYVTTTLDNLIERYKALAYVAEETMYLLDEIEVTAKGTQIAALANCIAQIRKLTKR